MTLDLFDQAGLEEESPGEGGNDGETPAAEAVSAPRAEAPATDTRGEDGPRIWTVSQVNRAVRNLLENTLPSLWVSGEVGGWKRARSGHCYFTLKDDRAQLRCVMWRSEARSLPTDPDEGMEVRVRGALTLYEARGEYQLVVRKLETAGDEGLWRLAFEKLRKKLEAEGLLATERKRPLPRFPASVGVVTSATGAALRDILSVIRRRAPWTRVVVRNARVQGQGAALEIAEALEALAGSGLVDVVIVGRGGGSVEDLWAFNEEPVARAVAAAPVPVISAVGHEVDVTISDLVADRRAPTPSAAAETVVQDGGALRETLQGLPARLSRALRGALHRRQEAVERGRAGLLRAMERLLQPRRQAVDRLGERLEGAVAGIVERRRARLSGLAGRLDALSPLATLRRGYAVPLGPEGRLLRRVEDFDDVGRFDLRVVDGRVSCTVDQTEAVDASAVEEIP